ncbi:MAG: hypothetical protein ABS938_14165 [Psychrobacillus psychrodurans]
MSNGAAGLNIGDIIAIIFTLGFIIIPIIVVVLFYRAYKKNTKRSEEKLNIEKQQTFNLQ